MKTEILSEELNSMKYLLGYKRGMVISEQTAPTTGTTAAPVTAAPVVAAPTTGTTAAPVVAAPTTGTTVAAAPATNVSMPDLIKQIQTILKTKFNATLGTSGPNKDGIDGVWGKNSQTAFENAIKTLNTQAASAAPTTGTPAPAAGAPVSGTTSTTQQKFNFNPTNFNPESGINFKPSTPKL
jgi:hypothetical protein